MSFLQNNLIENLKNLNSHGTLQIFEFLHELVFTRHYPNVSI